DDTTAECLGDFTALRRAEDAFGDESVAPEAEQLPQRSFDVGGRRARRRRAVRLDEVEGEPYQGPGPVVLREDARNLVQVVPRFSYRDGFLPDAKHALCVTPVAVHVGADELCRLFAAQVLEVEGLRVEHWAGAAGQQGDGSQDDG